MFVGGRTDWLAPICMSAPCSYARVFSSARFGAFERYLVCYGCLIVRGKEDCRGYLDRQDLVPFVDAWFDLEFICLWVNGGLAGANLHVGAMQLRGGGGWVGRRGMKIFS